MPKEVLWVRVIVYSALAGLLVAFLTACGGGGDDEGPDADALPVRCEGQNCL